MGSGVKSRRVGRVCGADVAQVQSRFVATESRYHSLIVTIKMHGHTTLKPVQSSFFSTNFHSTHALLFIIFDIGEKFVSNPELFQRQNYVNHSTTNVVLPVVSI
jgi:hypothetical protein